MRRPLCTRALLLVQAAGIAVALAAAGCGGSGESKSVIEDPNRGGIVGTGLVGALGKSQVEDVFAQLGLGELPAPYDIHFYRVIYRTVGLRGDTVTASGMVAVPRGVSGSLPVLSYQHGTTYAKTDVPSSLTNAEFAAVAAVACSSGYVTVASDYLGLGHSAGLHPYLHASTEATACLDMIRAGRGVCQALGIPLDGQLFLAGYSQGGHATMALHRLIESQHASEMTVTASAPCAGPYDLSGATLSGALTDPSANTPGYLLYLMASYEMVYDVFSSFSEALQPPYDVLARKVVDGEVTPEQAVAQIGSGATVSTMLQSSFVQAIGSNPNHPLVARMRDNDVYDWKPAAPVRLYHGTSDKDVPYQNSVVAEAAMKAKGADVRLVPLTGDHASAADDALLQAQAWFDTLSR